MINENELKEKLLKLVEELPALPLLKIEMGVKPSCTEMEISIAKQGMKFLEDSCGFNKEMIEELVKEYLNKHLKTFIDKIQEKRNELLESKIKSEFEKTFGGVS